MKNKDLLDDKKEKTINNRAFIMIGSLIWIASFFGEVFGFQPFSTIGIIISPILIFFWDIPLDHIL